MEKHVQASIHGTQLIELQKETGHSGKKIIIAKWQEHSLEMNTKLNNPLTLHLKTHFCVTFEHHSEERCFF